VELIYYVTAPALIFSSLVQSDISGEELYWMSIATVGVVGVLALLALGFFLVSRKKMSGKALPLIFGNTGYLGFPIALLAFGNDGLSRAVVYSGIETLLMFTIGIAIVTGKADFRETVRSPFLYVIVLGILFSQFAAPFPSWLLTAIGMIGQATIPLALILLGYRLSRIAVKQFHVPLVMGCWKIGAGFLIGFGIASLVPLSPLGRAIVILEAGMPAAVFTYILGERFRSDPELISSVVFISTAMSVVTIPLVLLFIS